MLFFVLGGEGMTTFISEVLFSEMFSTDARFFYILPNPKKHFQRCVHSVLDAPLEIFLG